MTELSEMPTLILINIFEASRYEDLLSVEDVCRKFRDILRQCIWPNVRQLCYHVSYLCSPVRHAEEVNDTTGYYSARRRYLTRSAISRQKLTKLLTKCAPYLTYLQYGGRNVGAIPLETSFCSLQTLFLVVEEINGKELVQLAKLMPKMKEFWMDSMNNYGNENEKISDHHFTQFLLSCPSLDELEIKNFGNLTHLSLAALPSRLTYLNMDDTHISSAALLEAARKCPKLEGLRFNASSWPMESYNEVMDRIINTIKHNIVELWIMDIKSDNYGKMGNFQFGDLPKLETLYLQIENSSISEKLLRQFSTNCCKEVLQYLFLVVPQNFCNVLRRFKRFVNIRKITYGCCINYFTEDEDEGFLLAAEMSKLIALRHNIRLKRANIMYPVLLKCEKLGSLTIHDNSKGHIVYNELSEMVERILDQRFPDIRERPTSKQDLRLFHLYLTTRNFDQIYENMHPWLARQTYIEEGDICATFED